MNKQASINAKLLRSQLDERFGKLNKSALASPREGWIKTLRSSLGMTSSQLAKKMSVSTATMSRIEKSEQKGTILTSTLKRVADVLDCELFVNLVPRQSLNEMIHARAKKLALKIAQQNKVHMDLEAQSNSTKFNQEQLLELESELIRNADSKLWDD